MGFGKLRKIALINPSTVSTAESHIYAMYRRNIRNYKPYLSPPLSLLTLAAHTPEEIEIELIDENTEPVPFDHDYDLVGITAMSQQAWRAYAIAAEFRKRGIPVVMGGIHASVMPEEALQHVDTVFIGEAENTWPQFLNDLAQGNPQQIYKGEALSDLHHAKTPRYDLIRYDRLMAREDAIRLIPVQATRGCPHDCNFCIVPDFYGKCIRKKDISQVVRDIERIKELNYNSMLLFVDDNLFVDRKYIKALLREIRQLRISYIAQTDIRVAQDEELLELAYQSGCNLMLIGFESIDSENLRDLNSNNWKLKQLETYTDSIRNIQKHGIIVFGSFIVGFDHDTVNTFTKIRDFVTTNHISAHFTILTALPGSRLYTQFLNEHRFSRETFWDNLSFYSLSFNHPNLSNTEAEKGIVWLYDEVYQDEVVMQRYRHMMQHYKKLPPRWEISAATP